MQLTGLERVHQFKQGEDDCEDSDYQPDRPQELISWDNRRLRYDEHCEQDNKNGEEPVSAVGHTTAVYPQGENGSDRTCYTRFLHS